jgi:catechol 2,3-dioxygenase-like lactoylglutathione lyase family enzyme
MIDHIILTVSDFERSVAFYAKALKPLGITNFLDYEGQDGHPDLKGLVTAKEPFSGSKKESPIPKRCMLGL